MIPCPPPHLSNTIQSHPPTIPFSILPGYSIHPKLQHPNQSLPPIRVNPNFHQIPLSPTPSLNQYPCTLSTTGACARKSGIQSDLCNLLEHLGPD
ncbi:hypothetical protein C7212DRAFT_331908 [Tuber magnatum]|uniref:Uncharacterized protein n=1 Tax=Tuber magnatum TaxID=42249 RepID=A0A317SGG7_9PEZI|nr:hypothetical protein C7212DRAFT_331908 [Tuber magnatum]